MTVRPFHAKHLMRDRGSIYIYIYISNGSKAFIFQNTHVSMTFFFFEAKICSKILN